MEFLLVLLPDNREGQWKLVDHRWLIDRRVVARNGKRLLGRRAPVASRFRTYGIDLDETSASYVKAIHGLTAMKRWTQAAKNEPMVNDRYEFD